MNTPKKGEIKMENKEEIIPPLSEENLENAGFVDINMKDGR